jgi:hypothetical protein
MKHSYYFYLFAIISLLSLTACVRPIPLDFKDAPKRLVVVCLFTENKPWQVHLEHSKNMGDTTLAFVENANVEIYEDNILHEKLIYTKEGLYEGAKNPQTGKLYEIRIKADNYPEINAFDSIPQKVKIKDAYYTLGKKYDMGPNPLSQIFILWQDPMGNNFYKASAEYHTVAAQLAHTLEIDNGAFVESNIVFTDKSFNGKAFQYECEKVISNLESELNSAQWFTKRVYLQSISQNYYLFAKTSDVQLANQIGFTGNITPYPGIILQFLSTSEPSNIYSNVENGFGIFAGYAVDSAEAYFVK